MLIHMNFKNGIFILFIILFVFGFVNVVSASEITNNSLSSINSDLLNDYTNDNIDDNILIMVEDNGGANDNNFEVNGVNSLTNENSIELYVGQNITEDGVNGSY